MKKIANLLAAVCMASMLLSFASCSKKKAASGGLTLEEGTLKIGMEVGYPPFEYFDADGTTPIGFDVQLGAEIARRLGLKVEYIDTAYFLQVPLNLFVCAIFQCLGFSVNKKAIAISAIYIEQDNIFVADNNFEHVLIVPIVNYQ